MEYTEGFRAKMVNRMLGASGMSANALARETGVSQSQLSRWLARAHTVGSMKLPDEKKPQVASPPKKWTVEEKVRVVAAAQGLEGGALGAFLRREGLHEEQLEQWQEAAAGALLSAEAAPSGALGPKGRKQLAAAQKRVKELERELGRKEKALAEAAALLLLEKKLQALGWDDRHQGDEDNGPDEESEK